MIENVIISSMLGLPTAFNLYVVVYFDDILIFSPDYESYITHVTEILYLLACDLNLLLSSLGLVINFEKSSFIPSRRLRHLGFIIDTTSRTFQIPPDKASDIFSPSPRPSRSAHTSEFPRLNHSSANSSRWPSRQPGATHGRSSTS